MSDPASADRLFVAPDAEAPMEERTEIEAVAGRGVRGDRYFAANETGTFVGWDDDEERPGGYDLTLIEQEALEAIERDAGVALAPGEHRRNVETRGVALNHLVGATFRIGEVRCRGVRLCEPCSHLESLTEDGVEQALVHRGGLRADVVDGGAIRAGDPIERID